MIRVYANPYAGGAKALDANGAAACFVGLRRPLGVALRHGRYVPTLEVVEVPVQGPTEHAYYRHALLDGYLIAADEATAKKMNVPLVDASAVLAAHEVAVDEWRAEHGAEPACATDFDHEGA